jgi:fucose permease
VALAIGILSLGFSERLNTRFGARRVLVPGLALIAVGLALITRVPVQADYFRDFLPAMLLLGVGAGLSFPALMSLSMSAATPSDSGLASGLANTSLQVGGALGLAVLATLAAGRTGRLVADGQSAAAALTDGYHLAVALGTGFVVVALALAVTVLRPSQAAVSDENVVGEVPAIEELAVEKLAIEQL